MNDHKTESVVIIDKSKSGIALLVTLGMLSVLMILAVSFTICMRTERVAAGNYRRSVNDRHVLQGAVAHAMADLNARIGNDPYPSTDDGWVFDYTDDHLAAADFASFMNFNDREMFIPDAIMNSAMKFSDAVTTSTGDSYTYIVFNVSGLLDANYAGGDERGVGADPSEIQIEDLSDIGNLEDFVDARDAISDFPHYETMASLFTNTAFPASGPANFINYSLCPPGFYDGTNISDASIPLASLTSIQSAGTYLPWLGECFDLNAVERLVLLGNIVDYMDDDFIPGNFAGNTVPVLNRGYVEPVPMINEIWFGAGTACRFTMSTNASGEIECGLNVGMIFLECAYPFRDIETPPVTYLNYDYELVINVSGTDMPLVPQTSVPEIILNIDNFNSSGYSTMAAIPMRPIPAFSTPLPGVTDGAPFTISLKIHNAKIEVSDPSGRIKVDELATTFPIELWSGVASAGLTQAANTGRECVDPRLNWEDSTNQWPVAAARTTGTENGATTAALTDSGTDGDTWMRVRNAPMQTVGDLGDIFLGKDPWQTVRLYKHGANNAHPVFDYFVAGTNTGMGKGLVNPNTYNEEVLEAVFKDMLISLVDDGSGNITTNRLNSGSEENIASAIIDNGPYMTLADLQNNVPNWSSLANAAMPSMTPSACDLDRETLIGNSFGLLGTRQQIFYIVVRGTRSKAIAMVWRDPFPNDDGVHPMVVRYIHVM